MPGLLATALAIGVVVACVTLLPKQVADLLGPVGVLLLFLSLLLVMATLLTYGYDEHQIPSIPVLLLIAVLCGALGSNNNHTLRLANAGAKEPDEVSSAFRNWLQERPDLGDRPYPVYVVTAEGGGLYAAAHAAFTLARVQDNCPAFASHVFAISGVSGGSLGSALFATLLKAHPPERKLDASQPCRRTIAQNEGTLQKAVFAYFREDLLTPLLAAALFPDFLQRFLPVRVEAFDRARALERGIEETWAKVMRAAHLPDHARAFAGDSRAVWAADADVPALLLNTTIVQSGDRAVIAPFRLESVFFRDFVVDLLNGRGAPTLSAAVSASARFPYILPPALYVNPENDELYQMIDGGYYENTGIQTAINLIDLLRGAYPPAPAGQAGAPPPDTCVRSNAATVNLKSGPTAVCFKVITIRARNVDPLRSVIDESATPIVGVYQARQAVARAGIQELLDRFCGGSGCGYASRAVQPHVYVQRLDTSPFPLAWSFSDTTLKALQKNDPEPVACWTGDGAGTAATADQANTPPDRNEREENACLQRRVAQDLATR
jgi:hypothetical protein